MFTQLLIAVDGSDCSTRAAKYGLELAKRYDAAVDVVHAIPGRETEHARDVLAEVESLDVDVDVDVETHLVEGTPEGAITDLVAERDADLIVMGRRGRSGIEEHLLGSVTERILRRVDVPVLTVAGSEIRSETGRAYEGVLLTTDGSEAAEQATPYGDDLAQRLDAVLHLLTVIDMKKEAGVFDVGGVSEEFVERKHEEARDALDRLESHLDADAVDLERAVVEGSPHTEIGEYTGEHDIDLLVMASEGESNLVGQRLGSTTSRVLRTVAEPVLVVPVTD